VHRMSDGDGTPTEWTIGLGILQGIAVVPHYDRWAEAQGLADGIAASCTVFGIAEDSAVLLDDKHGRALGAAPSMVRTAGNERSLEPGDRFELA